MGNGNFGSVYSAQSKVDSTKEFAIKSIAKDQLTGVAIERLQNELGIMARLDHPNIIRYHGTYQDKQNIHIVMEQCKGGELYDKLKSEGSLSETSAANIAF
jgi:calcium-dependent protein kinase